MNILTNLRSQKRVEIYLLAGQFINNHHYMKYRLLTICYFLSICLIPLSAIAQTPTVEVTEPGTGESLFAQHSDATELIVKGHINHLDLMALRGSCRSLESLDLSDTSIDAYSDEISYVDYPANELTEALAQYNSLKSLTLPSTLESIANKALYKCASLQTITIPGAQIPTVGGSYFVESKRMEEVALCVPEELLQSYKDRKEKAWQFKTITAIAPENPYAKVSFDDIYGPNYVPFSKENKDKRAAIYQAYFINNSNEIINSIEMEYWYDDEDIRRTVSLNEVQLLPGTETPDGQGTILLEAPEDTYTHLLHLRPSKINGVTVDHMQTTHKPLRVYELIDDFRFNEHLIELYYDPTDEKGQAKYANLVNALSTIIHDTHKNNKFSRERFCLVTITGQMKEGAFVPSLTDLKTQAKTLRIDSLPLFTYDRDLLTPYGTINNYKQLADLSIYTPTLRIGDVEDIHQYLFSRSYNYPAMCRMETPRVELDPKTQKFQIVTSGRINPNVDLSQPLRLTYYLIANDTLPEAYSDEMGQIAQGVTYGKLLQILSPVEGFPLEISDTRSFTHQTKPLEIPGYEPNKYRLVAIVHSSEDPHLYARTVLESYSIPLDLKHVSIRSVDPILSSAPQLILDSEGRICSNSPEWSVVDLYTLDGASLTSDSILPAGCYIVSLHHTNGATIYLKYIINK